MTWRKGSPERIKCGTSHRPHSIRISDKVYEYLRGMIDDEHIFNGDMSEDMNENGDRVAYRPTFSEVIEHLIEDREGQLPRPEERGLRTAKRD